MNLFIITIIFVGLILGYISTSGKKSQTVRLLDIFLIGPLMIYLGLYNFKISDNNKNDKINILSMLLIFFGSSTITYNLKNYIKFTNI
jgi:hypothetical protein